MASALDNFIKQDYPNKELIIVDDGDEPVGDLINKIPNIYYYYQQHRRSVGIKRNIACGHAKGEIIIHMDDDDWYAENWLTIHVRELIHSGADICGLKDVSFYSVHDKTHYKYSDVPGVKPWAYGGTLSYWKSYWEQFQFKDIQAGEDNDFLLSNNPKVHTFNYPEGYLGIIHSDNISMVPFENPQDKIFVSKWMRPLKKPELGRSPLSFPMSVNMPLVSCIMPTANRHKYIPLALNHFRKQDYPFKELVIIDDGISPIIDLIPKNLNIKYHYNNNVGTIGAKRNEACKMAAGSIIIHWDDDDWYAPDWISHQVKALMSSDADICGLNQTQFYSVPDNKYWMTKNMNSRKLWLSGATLAYYKSYWEKNNFKDIQVGEDDDFVRNYNARICAHDYYQGYIGVIHKKNTVTKVFE